MNETAVSATYAEAIGVHNNILAHAQIAQRSIFEMGAGIKKMRDGKLYKELGYQNFEEYCENALEIKHRQAYRYIAIVERLGENVSPETQNLGVKKLYLLSTLSEADRQELTERVDVEDISTRKLEEEIDKLKSENAELSDANTELTRACQKAHESCEELGKQVKELENRPIEVVAKDVDVEKAISEALRAEERKHAEALKRAEDIHKKLVRSVHQRNKDLTDQINALKAEKAESSDTADLEEEIKKLEAANRETVSIMEASEKKHKAEIEALQAQYTEELKNAAGGDSMEVFRAYFMAAYNAFNSMLVFVKDQPEETKVRQLERVRKFLEVVEKSMQEV